MIGRMDSRTRELGGGLRLLGGLGLTLSLMLGASGCGSPATPGMPAGTASNPQVTREKTLGAAPPNYSAQAMGGSGMPGPGQPGSGSGMPGTVLIDKQANPAAQSMGGSGMPGPN